MVLGSTRLTPVNFGLLRGTNKRIALMPQWDFLTLLAEEAKSLPNFHLLMGTTAEAVTRSGTTVTGVQATGPEGPLHITAALSVAADGRDSTLRKSAGLHPIARGVPIDVLWFRLPTPTSAPPDTLGYLTLLATCATAP
ncbi:FAD-dependent monooxygenase [Arthrobacter psychrochitiniphilus]|uniref:FAD-dependent monooxygenase n=1 Tax=Arthrobacter psychrochitiniphilus TaxID=291045 RepID=UPI003F7B4E97